MKKLVLALAALLFFSGLAGASPVYTYVGDWRVDSIIWENLPRLPNPVLGGVSAPALTGQEAAAFLFGGAASNYVISTMGSSPIQIDSLAWVSTWGGACAGVFPCGTKVAQDFSVSHAGAYAYYGDTSALITDWAIGSQFTNYAFLVTDSDSGAVPEPASIALLGLGIIGLVSIRRQGCGMGTGRRSRQDPHR
ncbi:MAG: PEP-CTERM sorting domain-containing protein [Pseudomonadota bacterium]